MQPAHLGFSDSKRHYGILDALRGVAAIMVVLFHILETFTGGDHSKQIINHGYLAVDFFFLLSGFVIGYAYDDRWQKMSLGGFFKRRLIRLHPMIIAGMVIGALLFYFQDCAWFPNIHGAPVWKMLLVFVIGCTLLPVPSSMDIRGWQEMHPLNGPAWSLFFEYIANILYALILRRLSNAILAAFALLAGAALVHLAVTNGHGDIIGGWSIEPAQLRVGFTRLLYPFLAGLLLSRVAKPGQLKHAFLLSAVLLIVMLSLPRIAAGGPVWINGLYDSLTVVLVFPLIVYIGASGDLHTGANEKIGRWLGDISYPLYMVHYPVMYTYMAWVANNSPAPDQFPPMSQRILYAVIAFTASILLAWAAGKFWDRPVRKWMMRKAVDS